MATSPITGEVISDDEKYVRLHDRFGVHPTTIWQVPFDAENKRLRAYVGDTSQLREGTFGGGKFLPGASESRGADSASIFNPVLAGMLVQAYSSPGDLIVDPFAGGGTRAIIAASMGRMYAGIDIREDEVDRLTARFAELNLSDRAQVTHADAARHQWGIGATASMLLTCPPYWNLEVYSDDPSDLSTKPTYGQFLDGLSNVVRLSCAPLKQGALSVWVVGEFRDPSTSELIDFPGDLIRIHKQANFQLYDHAIYTPANSQALRRVGTFEKTRKLVRVHERVLVFKWGGRARPRRAKAATGLVNGS